MGNKQEWAQNLVSEKQADRDSKQVVDKKIVSDRELIQAAASPLWNELRNEIKESVDAINQAMGSDVLGFENARVNQVCIKHNDSGRILTELRFNSTLCKLSVGNDDYQLGTYGVSTVQWYNVDNDQAITSEDLAEKIVARCFDQASQ